MKLTDVLIKPVLTEKVNKQIEKNRSYTFIVDRKSNKLEIKKAVEQFYGVTVTDVNTIIVPAKTKSRNTKSGVIVGRKPSKKKAIVKVAEGEEINLYGEI
ncbi:50S ribosomal protein L23 [Polluticaenibacter yanchengensis]|uniref:Large ribosomal subunit protein uL23 n=1 Tax=Polluticaenibacter yanchengensis TaxID=3014562 RepID=A0ABT4UJV0_9BACT|nr:50S ribosomal protein L23 [Chitinophagaceae bacterium LY-5]